MKKGIIIAIVSGVALTFVPTVKLYIIKFYDWFLSILQLILNLLSTSYALPGWAWLLIFVFTLIGLLTVFLRLKGDTEKPEFFSYTNDSIYNLNWRWEWIGNSISNLWCYCPKCDATLVYDDSSCSNWRENPEIKFICENCNNSQIGTITGGNKKYALGAIEREIVRRIRTNSYKK